MATSTLRTRSEGIRKQQEEAGGSGVTRTYRILGGKTVFERKLDNSVQAHDVIVGGIPAGAITYLIKNVRILSHGDALKNAVGVSLRTIQRKKKTVVAERLSAEQSSRAWRFAEILGQAIEVLGDQESAEEWMMTPAMALDNRRPIDLLASVVGAEAVENHLTRMEYGAYS